MNMKKNEVFCFFPRSSPSLVSATPGSGEDGRVVRAREVGRSGWASGGATHHWRGPQRAKTRRRPAWIAESGDSSRDVSEPTHVECLENAQLHPKCPVGFVWGVPTKGEVKGDPLICSYNSLHLTTVRHYTSPLRQVTNSDQLGSQVPSTKDLAVRVLVICSKFNAHLKI